VVIHSNQEPQPYTNVGTDMVRGGYNITEHLINHGYTSIGCIDRPRPMPSFVENIFKGYRQALAAHHLVYDEIMVFTAAELTIPGGYGLAERWLKEKHPLPRALLALDDLVCLGVLKKFREAGVRVPEDIALASFEDEHPWFDDLIDLTTMVQPGREKGRKAAELLLAAIDRPKDAAQQIVVEPYLKLRKSCGCSQS
jgi:DNA-binding LacI/PurR family transcriptional regulator